MNPLVKLSPKDIEWEELESISKPSVVYKYRSWNKCPLHNNLLLKNQLYLSAPSDFEDQMDCKNPIRYDLLTEQETRLWIEKTFRKLHPKYNDDSIKRHVDFYFERNGFRNEAYLERHRAAEWEAYNKMAGVLSLTVNPLNKDLWSKYGDHHNGIAYGFDTNKLVRSTKIPRGGLVQYVNVLPVIHPFHPVMEQVFIRIYLKTLAWAFEEEYRLSDFTESPRLRYFSDESLVQVVLGADFDQEQIPILKKHLILKGGHIRLLQVKRNNGGLEIESHY